MDLLSILILILILVLVLQLDPGLGLEGISEAVSLETPYTKIQDPGDLARREILPWALALDSYMVIHRRSVDTSVTMYLKDIAADAAQKK